MKQKIYRRICLTLRNMCDKMYLDLEDYELKNKSRFLRYASIFGNLAKVNLKKKEGKHE